MAHISMSMRYVQRTQTTIVHLVSHGVTAAGYGDVWSRTFELEVPSAGTQDSLRALANYLLDALDVR